MAGLDDNPLLDKETTDKAKYVYNTVKSGKEKAERIMLYLMIAKWATVGVLLLAFGFGAVYIGGVAKDAISNIAIEEVKETASEKVAEVKLKAKEAAAEHKVEVTPESVLGAVMKLAKNVNTSLDNSIDVALSENGFHPDAPANCALQNPMHPSSNCLQYSAVEVDGAKYREMQGMWDTVCPNALTNAMTVLEVKGAISHSSYYTLNEQCMDEVRAQNAAEREDIKRKMLGR